MLSLWIMLVGLSLSKASPQTNLIFFGSQAQFSIPITAAELGDPLDIAYSSSRRIFVLDSFSDGYHVRQWNYQGKLEVDWKLPGDVSPVSILFFQAGRLKTLVWDNTNKRFQEASFIMGALPRLTVQDLSFILGKDSAQDVLKYDRKLEPGLWPRPSA